MLHWWGIHGCMSHSMLYWHATCTITDLHVHPDHVTSYVYTCTTCAIFGWPVNYYTCHSCYHTYPATYTPPPVPLLLGCIHVHTRQWCRSWVVIKLSPGEVCNLLLPVCDGDEGFVGYRGYPPRRRPIPGNQHTLITYNDRLAWYNGSTFIIIIRRTHSKQKGCRIFSPNYLSDKHIPEIHKSQSYKSMCNLINCKWIYSLSSHYCVVM